LIKIARAIRAGERLAERSLKLYRLSRERTHIAEVISRTLSATLKRSMTLEEKSWIDRIEQLRSELNTSPTQITRKDFGAGGSELSRTQLEMRAGVEIQDTLGRFSQSASKSAFWCLLLFRLIRSVQPRSCVELGAAVGISAAYQAAALKLNGHGFLVTLEGAPTLADIAKNNLERLDLDNTEVIVGRFEDTLSGVLTSRRPIDYIFVDGHHDHDATLAYFEQISSFLSDTAFLVFDDIDWSEGMQKAWTKIAKDKRIDVAVDLGPLGLCVIDHSVGEKKYYRIPLR
jgi:predicted O-methyltransferase YrrM